MLSSFDFGKFDCNDSSNVEFLRDIEEISNALYVERKSQNFPVISSSKPQICDLKSMSKSGFDGENGSKNSSSSIWHWKPLKALSHFRHKKFACYFFCHVHCVENLALDLDGVCMSVCLRRKDRVLRTRSLRISNGRVDFEETLISKCNVYGAKSGHGNFMKYDPKHYLLCVSIDGIEGFDVGKHWVDLTRLLPLTVEELEKDKCSGKWSTSFRLEGKAKDATLQVSFGFLVTKDSLADLGGNIKLPVICNLDQNGLNRMSSVVVDGVLNNGNTSLRRVGSVPSSLTNASLKAYECFDVKDTTDFSNSITMLYGKLEEESIDKPTMGDVVYERLESFKIAANSSSESKDFRGAKHENDDEFTVVEKGVESESNSVEGVTPYDSTSGDLGASTVEVIDVADIFLGDGISSDEDTKSSVRSKANNLEELSVLEPEVVTTSCDFKVNYGDEEGLIESLNLEPSDDLRSRELKPLKVMPKGKKLVKSLSLDDIAKAVAEDFCNMWQESTTLSSPNSNANLESPRDRLLREFEEDMMMNSGSFFLGTDVVDEEAACISSTDYTFDDSVDFSPIISEDVNESVNSRSKIQAKTLELLETQSLMQSWGLNEDTFLSSPHYSSGGFGSPIFVPSESSEPLELPPLGDGLGSLLHLKDGGLLRSMSPHHFKNVKNGGRLVMQASKLLMFAPELSSDIMDMLQGMASLGSERLSKKLSLLLPLEETSGKIIQQLAWEASKGEATHSRASSAHHETDLKTNDDPEEPVTNVVDLSAAALDSIEALTLEGLKIQSGMSSDDAPSSVRVKPVNETGNCLDLLFDLSVSLDEWLRRDSGMSSDENCGSHQTSTNLTMGLMIQLRDPLRNYEPVGAPMLGLIQMDRVENYTIDGKIVPEFRAKDVHLAGLNLESDFTDSWSSKRQQQTGTRWLLASGLTRKPEPHVSKSKSLLRLSTQVLRKPWRQNFLWSVSRPVQGGEIDAKRSMWDMDTRNPNLIFPQV